MFETRTAGVYMISLCNNFETKTGISMMPQQAVLLVRVG
jgi:hypothetical protein